MESEKKLEKCIGGKRVTAELIRTQEGVRVLICGEGPSHIGAASYGYEDGSMETVRNAGHRDYKISEKWCREILEAVGRPVCVECGLYYENPDEAALREIFSEMDLLLNEALRWLKGAV